MRGILFIFLCHKFVDSRAEIDCYYDGNDFCIDQDDIMSVDLMPGSILLMDPKINVVNRAEEFENVTVDGSMDSALDEMDFHRKRMNEYLCHGFMAEEIFREMKTVRVKRRPSVRDTYANSLPDFLGVAPEQYQDSVDYKDDENINEEDDNVTVQHKLLADEGSAKYKDWLHRTTTLDDVYRHYGPSKKLKKKISYRHPPRGSSILHSHNIDEFDGEVTGFAMPASITADKIYYGGHEESFGPPFAGHNVQQYSEPEVHPHHSQHSPHIAEIVPIFHEEYYGPTSHQHDDEYWHRPSHSDKGKGHELTIKDFFEIALTALAFLAFGVFVIQLLMSLANSNSATTVVRDPDALRLRRDAGFPGSINYARSNELNELTHTVLRSIEAAMVADKDSGRCLRWSLCNDNRSSINASGTRKIWLPVWSLGMSWVSGRVVKNGAWPTMLESIKASVLGLGGADCSTIYPDCDLARERIKRRRRRRK